MSISSFCSTAYNTRKISWIPFFPRAVLGAFLAFGFSRQAVAQVIYTGSPSVAASFPATYSISPIASDNVGDSFFVVSSGNTNTLYELPANGTPTALNAAFPYAPSAIAVDGPGANLYFIHFSATASCNGGYVNVATATVTAGTTPTDLPCSFSFSGYTIAYTDPTGLALDSAGNLYVADFGGGEIFRLPAPLSSASVPNGQIALFQQPFDLAVASTGTAYYTALDYNNNSANTLFSVPSSAFSSKLPANGTVATNVVAGLPSIQSGLAIDGAGSAYLGGGSSPTVRFAGSAQTPIFSFANGQTGLALDAAGDLFLTGTVTSGKLEVVKLRLGSAFAGSKAVGATAAPVTLDFHVMAGTTVGSVSVLTGGLAGKDFTDAGGSTCTAQTYATDTDCVVNVHMAAKLPGMRSGAVLVADGTGAGLATVPVFGTGISPQLVFQGGAASTLVANGLNVPFGLRVDAVGNVYIADTYNSRVLKVTPGGAQSTVGSGFLAPVDVLVDGAGNLLVSDEAAGEIFKITPEGAQKTMVSVLSCTFGLSLDQAGNLYVCEALSETIVKIAPNGARSQVGSGLGLTYSSAFDLQGNLYTVDFNTGNLYKLTPAGNQTLLTNIPGAVGVAIDPSGTLYLAVYGAKTIVKLVPGGMPVTLATGLGGPYAVTLDGAGNLYYTDNSGNAAYKTVQSQGPAFTFATTAGGATSSDSPQTATVANAGNAALTIGSVHYPVDFPKDSAGNATACSTNPVVAPSATCTLSIDFKPVSLSGTQTSLALAEQVTLTSNTLNVTGTGAHVSVSGTETKLVPTVVLSAAIKTVGATSELQLTARATGSGAVPGGLVTFESGGVGIGQATLTSTGAATIAVPRPTLRHTFTAVTAGDAVYAGAKSNGVVINPTVLTPTVVLSSSANPAAAGSVVTLSTTVTSGVTGLPPSGSVQFTIGGAVVATVQLNEGQASYSTNSLTVGTHTVVATYLGDANYAATAANTLKQTITH